MIRMCCASLVEARFEAQGIRLQQREFDPRHAADYDFVVWATYGLGPSRGLFKAAKYQVAEKMLIELPLELRGIALVVVDGPFTAFDPYGSSSRSLFGSAKNTNHWTTTNACEPIPEPYAGILNKPEFQPVAFTRICSHARGLLLSAFPLRRMPFTSARDSRFA